MKRALMTRGERRRLAAAALATIYLDNWTLDVARKKFAGRVANVMNPRKREAALRAMEKYNRDR